MDGADLRRRVSPGQFPSVVLGLAGRAGSAGARVRFPRTHPRLERPDAANLVLDLPLGQRPVDADVSHSHRAVLNAPPELPDCRHRNYPFGYSMTHLRSRMHVLTCGKLNASVKTAPHERAPYSNQ